MAEPRERLSFRAVVGRGGGLLRRNALAVAGVGLLLGALPQFIFGLLRVTGVVPDPGADALAALRGAPGETIIVNLASVLAQGALISLCLADVQDSRPGVGAAIRVGADNFLRLVGLSLLVNIAVVLGLILLIVPGLLLAARWLVAGPVLIASPAVGITDALGRSAKLTEGHRWVLVGLLLTAVVAVIGLGLLLTVPLFFFDPTSDPSLIIQNLIVDPLSTLLIVVAGGVGVPAVYIELRRIRDGIAPGGVAEVFS